MAALIGAIFVASVLGSLHCAGMCGAFLAMAVASGPRPVARWKMQAGYHGGRLVSYVVLGAIAGTLGAAADLAGTLAGLKPVAASLAGAVMVAFGVVSLARLAGWSFATLHPPRALLSLSQSLHRRAMNTPPLARATSIGLLTTLLPCGWLWAFVVTAAGTASTAWGAVAMAVFWAGTLPVMVALGAGVQGALGAFGRKLPVLTCLLLVGVGIWTLAGRSMLDVQAFASHRAAVSGGEPHPAAPDPAMVPDCCKPDAQDP